MDGFAPDLTQKTGVEAAFARCNEMLAFAARYRTEETLGLARDRLGVKPLCYGSIGRRLIFVSELKALRGQFSSEGVANGGREQDHDHPGTGHCISGR